MNFNIGDLVTVEPQPVEDIISGQQYLPDIIKEVNYLGVVTGLRVGGKVVEVRWIKHPTKLDKITRMRSVWIKRVLI
tara:strand:+ start:89 stop:319 length:231 start_codon:yes stop_codon:yes gene_type:complete